MFLRAPPLDRPDELRARRRQRVAAVGEGVDHEVHDAGLRRHLQQPVDVLDARVHAAVGDEADQVHPRGALQRRQQHLVATERLDPGGLVDQRQVLLHDRSGAEVHMADLGVAHLPVGQSDGGAAGRQRRVRVARPEGVEDRCAGERDGVAGPSGGEAPAIQDDEAGRGRIAHTAAAASCVAASTILAKFSGSSDAPPTSAPSTSGSASSSGAVSGVTDPP
jgi:hypothetical protein